MINNFLKQKNYNSSKFYWIPILWPTFYLQFFLAKYFELCACFLQFRSNLILILWKTLKQNYNLEEFIILNIMPNFYQVLNLWNLYLPFVIIIFLINILIVLNIWNNIKANQTKHIYFWYLHNTIVVWINKRYFIIEKQIAQYFV